MDDGRNTRLSKIKAGGNAVIAILNEMEVCFRLINTLNMGRK